MATMSRIRLLPLYRVWQGAAPPYTLPLPGSARHRRRRRQRNLFASRAKDVQNRAGSREIVQLPGVRAFMPRLVVFSSVACLSLVAGCVNTSQPAKVAACAPNCSDNPGGSGGGGTTGTGGIGGHGGTTSSVGGTTSIVGGTTSIVGGTTSIVGGTTSIVGGTTSTAGGTAGSSGGTTSIGGTTDTGGGTAGGSGGATSIGGTTDTGGDTAGTGGGTAGTGGGGSSGSDDGGTDAPVSGPETGSPSDAKPLPPDVFVQADTPPVAPEASGPEPGPEPGPDAPADLARDLVVDLTPDTAPPRPEAGLDAGTCIQRFQASGYSLGTDAAIAACSGCIENSTPKESQCKAMIDCIQPSWPSCTRGSPCWTNCQNTSGSDSVVEAYVATLVSAACGTH
jgi:hypothetical protein